MGSERAGSCVLLRCVVARWGFVLEEEEEEEEEEEAWQRRKRVGMEDEEIVVPPGHGLVWPGHLSFPFLFLFSCFFFQGRKARTHP